MLFYLCLRVCCLDYKSANLKVQQSLINKNKKFMYLLYKIDR